jgi:hypothetical protein
VNLLPNALMSSLICPLIWKCLILNIDYLLLFLQADAMEKI